MRVTKGGAGEAQDLDVIGYELADPEDRFAPVRIGYAGYLVSRRRRGNDMPVLGDLVGGTGHRRNGDGSFMPAGGGIAARRLG